MLYIKNISESQSCRAAQHEAAYELLSYGLKNEYQLEITKADIDKTELGKPFLKAHPHIHFSLSHCKGLVVCLISQLPCGVDCEAVRTANDKIVKRIFTGSEAEKYNSLIGDDRNNYFTALWTLKEAYGKTIGNGLASMSQISFDLSDISTLPITVNSDHNEYHFQLLTHNNYHIAVCNYHVSPESIITL